MSQFEKKKQKVASSQVLKKGGKEKNEKEYYPVIIKKNAKKSPIPKDAQIDDGEIQKKIAETLDKLN